MQDVDGNAVQPTIQRVFDTHTIDPVKTTKSLSMGASLVTKLAMAIITYGALGMETLTAHMASAGYSTLCGQAAVALVENNGDPLKATRALACADTLKSMGRSMATAGIVHGLTCAFSDTVAEATTGATAPGQTVQNTAQLTDKAAKTLTDYAKEALIQSATDTVVSAAMDGIPLDKLLQRGLMIAALNTAAAYGAGGIGGKYLHKTIGTIEHKIYHGLLGAGLGATIAAVDKRDAALGALSGMMGSVVAETVAEMTAPDASRDAASAAAKEGLSREEFASRFSDQVRRSTNFGNLSAALSALAIGLEVDIAHQTAVNATSHNHTSIMAVMQESALDLFDEIMHERMLDQLADEVPLTPRTRSAQESLNEFSTAYSRLDEVQKEIWRQTGQSPENACNNAYAGTQRLIAEAAVAKVAAGQTISDYEKGVIVDAAKSGAITLSTQVAASVGLGIIASTVTKTFVKVAGNKVVTASKVSAGEVAQFRSVSGKISETPITWTAPTGTGQTYKVWQRTDIDWNMVRTAGDKRFIGKTNREAAQSSLGLPPQLSDGSFATLHHIGQNNAGPLVEASRRYHGIDRGNSGHHAIHSLYGRNKPHPEFPVDQKIFQKESAEYWKVRVAD